MGKLFYVVGASGVGKDSLMNYARNNIGGNRKVIFAHRYITRDAFAGGENHVALTKEEFAMRKNAGLFALDWESHNQCYGIGTEINTWLQLGFNVVVNGSRQYLPQAKLKYPGMADVLIVADPAIIAQRLAARNRESGDEIKKRINRSGRMPSYTEYAYVIETNGLLEEAG